MNGTLKKLLITFGIIGSGMVSAASLIDKSSSASFAGSCAYIAGEQRSNTNDPTARAAAGRVYDQFQDLGRSLSGQERTKFNAAYSNLVMAEKPKQQIAIDYAVCVSALR